jgi:protein-disulfide isomerase
MKIDRLLTNVISAVTALFAAAAATAAGDNIRPANTLGPANAPVLIEFFSDLQCPQCARYEPMVKSVRAEFGDKTRMVLRHFPLTAHEHAVPASWAAEAAANQGKFWEMAESLYKTQWMWARAPAPRAIFIDQAKQLGLDVDKFQKDMDSAAVHDRITADQEHAQSVGVKTAPSVVINGYNVPNTEFSENGFRAAIKAALAKAGQ